jgi:hypothetical protein
VVPVLLVLAVGVGSAFGAIPNPGDGKYYACRVKATGAVRLINFPKVSTCPAGERLISWNAKGPQGPAGTQGAQGPKGDQGPAGPADWNAIPNKPAGFADGIDDVGSVGYFSGVQVTQSTPLAIATEETWFTFGWSSSFQVLWSVVPTNTGAGQERLLLTERSERAADGTITYWLTVRNDGNVASTYRLRYVAFNSGIAVAKKANPNWLKDVGVKRAKRSR